MDKAIKLGPRLQKIASFVPRGTFLGDIGTDHAYLPVYLLQQNIIERAVGVDIHQGPYESALETVRAYGFENRIEIRLGNGLIPIKKKEIDTLVIAGMGGKTILEILRSNPAVLEEIDTIILQPQGAEGQVRQNLLLQGWKLSKECMVAEENLLYTVLCFSRFTGYDFKDMELRIKQMADEIAARMDQAVKNLAGDGRLIKFIWQLGPLLILDKEEQLLSIIKSAVQQRRKVIAQMAKTDRKAVKEAAWGLLEEIDILEGIKKWLFL
jgi:tRNA (adenine22-N1)-methyltransferase